MQALLSICTTTSPLPASLCPLSPSQTMALTAVGDVCSASQSPSLFPSALNQKTPNSGPHHSKPHKGASPGSSSRPGPQFPNRAGRGTGFPPTWPTDSSHPRAAARPASLQPLTLPNSLVSQTREGPETLSGSHGDFLATTEKCPGPQPSPCCEATLFDNLVSFRHHEGLHLGRKRIKKKA